MNIHLDSIVPALPEIFLSAMACVILVLDSFLKDRQRHLSYGLSQLALVGAAILTAWLTMPQAQTLFYNGYIRDFMGDTLKICLFGIASMTFVYAKDYLRRRNLFRGEYYVLGLFAVLGSSVIITANSFLTLYLGLELLALCLYALVAFDRHSPLGAEAAMKYFVLGALASGMLLYGISMIYGATGSIQFEAVAQVVGVQGANNEILLFGLVFLIMGLAFKFGAVPLHMWVPDVYQGAPTPVTLFIASGPKIAAFGLSIRLLVDGLNALHNSWQDMLIILAILSLGLGNLIAIAQSNIKRMFAYSAIAQIGFILMGLLAGTADGYAAAMFYAIVYALTAAGGFGILILLGRRGFEAENLEDLQGLNERNAWYAVLMALFLFSMAGVPPTVGFFAKLAVLKAVVGQDLVWLAVLAVIFSLVGAFYYLRVIKFVYFDPPTDNCPLEASGDMRLVLSLNGIAVLGLGMFPAGLLSVCHTAFQ